MTETQQILTDRGFSSHDIAYVIALIEDKDGVAARNQAAELLHRIFLRLERDSPHGCALRRALGLADGVSLSTAAAAFCVTKQYMEDLQSKLETKLGSLAVLMHEARAASANVPASGTITAGPPRRFLKQR